MTTQNQVEEVKRVAAGIRRLVLAHTIKNNGGYLSQACSSAEIWASLYTCILHIGEKSSSHVASLLFQVCPAQETNTIPPVTPITVQKHPNWIVSFCPLFNTRLFYIPLSWKSDAWRWKDWHYSIRMAALWK